MNKSLIDKLYNSCLALSQKATKGMVQILSKNLIKPINPTGIINQVNLDVTKTNEVITIQTHFPDYAWFVENGRSAGRRPPIEPIRRWCEMHNLPKGMEWYMQKRIGAKGTKGKHFLEPLRRMLEMLQKTLQTVSITEFKAEYRDIVYSGTEMLRELKLKL